jgi:hypothetical protein
MTGKERIRKYRDRRKARGYRRVEVFLSPKVYEILEEERRVGWSLGDAIAWLALTKSDSNPPLVGDSSVPNNVSGNGKT